MDKGTRNKLIIAIGAIALVVLTVFIVINYLWPKHKWNENYANEYKEPYGGYLCEQLLKNYYPSKKYSVLKDKWDSVSVITDTNTRNSNYVFLGSDYYMDSASASTLSEYVARGNTAMIITPIVPYDILQELGISTCKTENPGKNLDTETGLPTDSTNAVAVDTTEAMLDSISVNKDTTVAADDDDEDYKKYLNYEKETYVKTPSVNLNFTHPKLQTLQGYTYHYIQNLDTVSYYWQYIVPDQECLTYKFDYSELGILGNDHVNFIRVKYGKGYFLLHTTPIAFSNYYLLDKEHLVYAEKAFSHLTEGNIYWDEYSQQVHPGTEKHERYQGEDEPTPLRFILSQDSLRWAWYMVLAMVVLYSVFQLKRRQRLIPVLEPNTNTSMEFAQTVSRLYFQQNDHRSLAIQQMRLFLSFIRSRYHINTSQAEAELQKRIVAKSGIKEEDISLLFGRFKHIQDMPSINEAQLIEFHQSLENFYQQCK